METSKSVIVKSTIWYLFCSFLTQAIGFLTAPIFVRLLTKEEFGLYNNFFSWASVLTVLVGMGIHATLNRARFDFEGQIESYIFTIILMCFFIDFIFYLLVATFGRDFWSDLLSIQKEHLGIIFLIPLYSVVMNLFQVLQQIQYKYKLNVLITSTTSVLSLFLSLIGILLLEDNLTGRIIGQILPFVICSIILFIYYLRKSERVRFEYIKYGLSIALPFIPHLLSIQIMGSIDKLMITHYCGAEKNALYSVAFNCATIISFLWVAMNNSYSPWLGECLKNKKYDSIRAFHYKYIFIFVGLACGLLLIVPELVYFVGGKDYLQSTSMIPPLILSVSFQFLYSMYVNIEQYEKKTKGMAIATCISALVDVVLNYLLIPRFGYWIAAYTTMISYLVLFMFHYLLVRKMKLHKVYHTAYVFGATFFLMIFGLLMLFVYEIPWLRYLILVIYMGIFIWYVIRNRKEIILIIKSKTGIHS